VPGGQCLGIFAAHGWKCTWVAFTPAGDLVLSSGTDGMLRLWEWPDGRAAGVLAGHANSVSSVCVSADGRLAVSASEDATIRAWDLRAREEVRCYRGHRLGIRCVAVTPRGDRIVSGSTDGTVRAWDVRGTQAFAHDAHQNWVNGVAVTPDGRYAVTTSDSQDARLMLTDIDTGEPVVGWPGHDGAALGVAITQDGRRAVSGSVDGRARVWNIAGAQRRVPSLVCEFTAGEQVCPCAVSPDGKVIMIGTYVGRVHTLTRHEDDCCGG
jgi:WD40 repeat protein